MSQAVFSKAQVFAALQDVNDPEMPISVVDLGLIYDVTVEARKVKIQLGLTATACPAIDFIFADITERLKKEGCEDVEFELVWDPPWTKERISEAGRFILTTWGLSV